MSVPRDEVVQLVCGVLADSGSSSTNPRAVVNKALSIWEEMDAAIAAKNKDLEARKKAEEAAAKATAEAEAKAKHPAHSAHAGK